MNAQDLRGGTEAMIYPTAYGTTLLAPELTCFRLWAPNATRVDVMIDGWETAAGNAHGWQVARWVQANAAALGVRYVIFNAKSWNVGEPLEPWGDYSHRPRRTAGPIPHTSSSPSDPWSLGV